MGRPNNDLISESGQSRGRWNCRITLPGRSKDAHSRRDMGLEFLDRLAGGEYSLMLVFGTGNSDGVLASF